MRSRLRGQKNCCTAQAMQQFVFRYNYCAACARQSSMAVNTASLVIVLPEMASTPAEEPASVSERARLSAAFPPSSGVSPDASMATYLAAGDGHGDRHLAQTALCTGRVTAVMVSGGVVRGRDRAGVGDIQGQNDAEDDVQDQHQEDVAGRMLVHSVESAPLGGITWQV